MALISLTWEIERGPDCAQKQVIMHYQYFPFTNKKCRSWQNYKNSTEMLLSFLWLFFISYLWYYWKWNAIAERSRTLSEMGYHARSCNDSSEQISKAETLYTYCTWQGNNFWLNCTICYCVALLFDFGSSPISVFLKSWSFSLSWDIIFLWLFLSVYSFA